MVEGLCPAMLQPNSALMVCFILATIVVPLPSLQVQGNSRSHSFFKKHNASLATGRGMPSNPSGVAINSSTSFSTSLHGHGTVSDSSAFTASQVEQLTNIVDQAVATHLRSAVSDAVASHLHGSRNDSSMRSAVSDAVASHLHGSRNDSSMPAMNATGFADLSKKEQLPDWYTWYTDHGKHPGVVHFLFLVNDDIPHSALWAKFFADGRKGSYTAFVHCRDPAGCGRNGLLQKLPALQQVSTVGSWYCHDLVTAMVHLLKAAVNQSTAPKGAVEKFVWVSDSTLPLKPFNNIHQELCSNDLSDFCISPREQWAYATIDGHDLRLLKHHQWVVLNRKHAETLIKNWVPVNAQAVWHVPLKGGSWKGKERDLSPQHFLYPGQTGSCADEWAIFATIFGAVEPMGGYRTYPGMSGPTINMQGPYSASTQGVCRTFSYWGNRDGELFANLGSQLAGEGNKLSCYPYCSVHPATIEWLSDAGLTALRASPFMFGRKFSSTMPTMNYYNLVLNDNNAPALLKISHVSVPLAAPANSTLDSALATWRDKALNTYIKESAKAAKKRWPVKVAFVFMVYEEVRFAGLWEAYFKAVPSEQYAVLVHASDGERASGMLSDFFRQRLVGGLPKGEWCHFSKVQLALIRKAFTDEAVTHLTWISGDAIPLQSLSTIRAALEPPARSFFCVDHISKARAEMWTVLARPHALTLAQNEESLWNLYTRFGACEDETVFYEPLKTLGVGSDVLVDRCIMWSAWGTRKGTLSFQHEVSALVNASGKHINSKQFERRADSEWHPATFSSVSSDGLKLLLNLPDGYFFARKFTSDCEVETDINPIHTKEHHSRKLSDVLQQFLNLTNMSASGGANTVFRR